MGADAQREGLGPIGVLLGGSVDQKGAAMQLYQECDVPKTFDLAVGDRVQLTHTGSLFTIDGEDVDLDLFHLAGHDETIWHSRQELKRA
jgi:hypothetical protein